MLATGGTKESKMICKDCGGYMIGDGIRTVIHCERVDYGMLFDLEPDSDVVYCNNAPDEEIQLHFKDNSL